MTKFKYAVLVTGFLAFCCATVKAQYIGYPLLGMEGLNAGSQLAPGYYFSAGYFRWSDINLNNPQGVQIGPNVGADINLFITPAIHVTLPHKFLGATYGFAFTQWVLNGLVTAILPNRTAQITSNYGYGDLYVQPLILGWHLPHADLTLGYAFWAPTGGSHGLNQWQNEINFGTTLYLDHGKKWNVSTLAMYDMSQPKNNGSDVRVGNLLTLMGGATRSFLKGAGSAGAAYGAQWKMTPDSGSGIPPFVQITNGRVFGVGPEVNMPVFAKGTNVGVVGFRYLFTVAPKTQLGGNILVASFTFAHIIPPGR